MADINSPIEMPVTTGPLPGSRKIHVAGELFPDIRVAMREVKLPTRTNGADITQDHGLAAIHGMMRQTPVAGSHIGHASTIGTHGRRAPRERS